MFPSFRNPQWGGIRSSVCALLSLLGVVLGAASSRANVMVELVPSTFNVAPGSTGNVVEVDLVVTGSNFSLEGFNADLDASPANPGINFTGADMSTTAPYALNGNSSGPALFFNPNPNGFGTVDINDSSPTLSDSVLTPGTYGLGRIFYSVDANAPVGPASIVFDPSTSLTYVDPNFNIISYSPGNASYPLGTQNASGTVGLAPTGVPEPASLALWGFAAAAALVARRRATRRQST